MGGWPVANTTPPPHTDTWGWDYHRAPVYPLSSTTTFTTTLTPTTCHLLTPTTSLTATPTLTSTFQSRPSPTTLSVCYSGLSGRDSPSPPRNPQSCLFPSGLTRPTATLLSPSIFPPPPRWEYSHSTGRIRHKTHLLPHISSLTSSASLAFFQHPEGPFWYLLGTELGDSRSIYKSRVLSLFICATPLPSLLLFLQFHPPCCGRSVGSLPFFSLNPVSRHKPSPPPSLSSVAGQIRRKRQRCSKHYKLIFKNKFTVHI